ncbi:pyrimidine 5'-nucleotidase [Brevundimonas lenta]|uniref:Putative hydrolase of the HAD superfamily n=1 Tax=Brevundimonas lenta TaxID=424796 RepID=A0A7W6JB20_9CAUL|nr:pyrimidine 5'-nucleotidase [Brevundimonas lenta]MBB4081821.1 putative hydrolase of the HAD superfamily [Brevundimonas lenta]
MTAQPVETTELGADLRHVRAWVFDLDDTLYPPERQVLKLVAARIGEFMARATGLPPEEARALQRRYLMDHGAALGGLMQDYTIDPVAFLAEVHDVPLDALEPSEGLRAGLSRLQGPRYVFTNGSRRHGERVLEKLGIADLFDGLFGIEDAELRPKPHPLTFDRMLARFGLNPRCTAFFEDTERNLELAKSLGMTTILVGPTALNSTAPFVDFRAASLPPFLATAHLAGDPA